MELHPFVIDGRHLTPKHAYVLLPERVQRLIQLKIQHVHDTVITFPMDTRPIFTVESFWATGSEKPQIFNGLDVHPRTILKHLKLLRAQLEEVVISTADEKTALVFYSAMEFLG